MTDRVARGDLRVAPAVHSVTGKPGFAAWSQKLLGNFPICWNATRAGAEKYALIFIKRHWKG